LKGEKKPKKDTLAADIYKVILTILPENYLAGNSPFTVGVENTIFKMS